MSHPLFEAVKKEAMPHRLLTSVDYLLGWDQETHMPSGSIEARSAQKEYIAGLCHKELTSENFAKALGELIDLESGEILIDSLSDKEKAAAKGWRRDVNQAKKLPGAFVEQWSKVTSEATHIWQKARAEDCFDNFAPKLTEVFELARQRADYLGYNEHIYDALLDEYEPEATASMLDPLFADLKPFLIDLTKQVSSDAPDLPDGPYAPELQKTFCTALLHDMGLTPHNTTLSVSAHPFCLSLHPSDVRLTTHIDTESPIPCISAVMHEGGHGLYEAGLPAETYGTPLSDFISLGIHESQSRFWEVLIGQSRPFWECYFPKLQKIFPQLTTLDDFYTHLNRVGPSFIRVHSDEVTYTLHVILRYELEKELLTGSLSVKDLPEAWNAKMQEYLGITPPTFAKGCLQDIHWSHGFIGYFPTYALGNLYSTQFFQTFKEKHSDFETRISSGDLGFIREFLRTNIHCHGRRYSAQELVQKVTNNSISSTPYRSHLTDKYIINSANLK